MQKLLCGGLVAILCLLAIAKCADHDTFKDCSRVNFCANLRTRSPQDKYVVDPSTITLNPQGTLELVLDANDGSESLSLTLYSLEKNRFRVKVGEVNSTRYQLQYVLVREPVLVRAGNIDLGNNFVTVIVGDYNAKVNFSPFSIEFYLNEQLQVVFDGSRLTFEEDLDEAFAFGVSFPQAVQLYGIPEHADSLALQTTAPGGTDPYRLRNLDVSGYELYSPMALYGSVPVLYGHGRNGSAGIFLHNAAEQWYEINNENSTAYVLVESAELDLFVLLGPTLPEAIRQYVDLTGTPHLPPLWALGYHQSRWSYPTQNDVKDVVANFTTYDFPLDAIWLDIDYTDGKKYFTWNLENFSDPIELQQNISITYKRLVTIIDPHIKVEQGYSVYDTALQNNLFITTANGSNFEGDCWPGLSSYLDFLNPETRNYYSSLYSYENFENSTPVIAGIWNDMNEPSVFDNSLEKTLPGDALHVGGVLHRDVHNIYGFLQTLSTHQGLLDRDNDTQRPFILSRAHFAGTQRYSAIWTGDNEAEWGHLSISFDECLNANLVGIAFCGADVGGFAGEPSVELLQRWYQAGAWLPFFRGHSALNTNRREPYLFDEDVQAVIRETIRMRYQHLAVFYTLFYQHIHTGDPIIRPLFYHYPEEDVYNLKDHLLLGSDILVRAVTEPGVDSVEVYFPGGNDQLWLALNNSTEIYRGNGLTNISVDITSIPVYYRGGSVLCRKLVPRLSVEETFDDAYSIFINFDEDNKATGKLFTDDFTTFDYLHTTDYFYLQIDADDKYINMTTAHDFDNSTNAIDIVFDKIVVHKIIETPVDGKAGHYEETVFEADENMKSLREFNFKNTNNLFIILPDTEPQAKII